jgi:hypothetical protein
MSIIFDEVVGTVQASASDGPADAAPASGGAPQQPADPSELVRNLRRLERRLARLAAD